MSCKTYLKMSEAICRWRKWLWISVVRSHTVTSYLSSPVLFQSACVTQYEHKDLAEFLEGLWSSLRREVCCEMDRKIRHFCSSCRGKSLKIFVTAGVSDSEWENRVCFSCCCHRPHFLPVTHCPQVWLWGLSPFLPRSGSERSFHFLIVNN